MGLFILRAKHFSPLYLVYFKGFTPSLSYFIIALFRKKSAILFQYPNPEVSSEYRFYIIFVLMKVKTSDVSKSHI